MPHLTLTQKSKLQLSPGLVASYDVGPRNTFTYLLAPGAPVCRINALQTKIQNNFAAAHQREG